MSSDEKVPDCRCNVCGCCRHDHDGWHHQWTPTPLGELPGTRSIGMLVDHDKGIRAALNLEEE